MKVIGEKINGTLKALKPIIDGRDEAALVDLARRQAEAGAAYIDVNVGTGKGSAADEAEAMRWAVKLIEAEVETPLCIDSADPAVLAAGLEASGRPGMINSAKAEDGLLQAVVPLAAEHGCALVGLAMDEGGIPKTVEERLRACGRIAEACDARGVELGRLYFDPLVLPLATDVKQGQVTLDTLSEIKRRFAGAGTVMGLSNISFGLPRRAAMNQAFLHMAVAAGLDAAIMDPLNREMMLAALTAEALVGKDRHCRRYTRALRSRG